VRRVRGVLAGPIEFVLTIVIAVGIAVLLQAFVVKPYRIPSLSMFPTIKVGQRVLANRLDTHPHLGDIVVFHPPAGANSVPAVCGNHDQGPGHLQPCDQSTQQQSSQTFIKRVVGLPGDRIAIRDGHVIRNGAREKAPYAQPCGQSSACTFSKTITVPPGQYYMMGDNRGNSDDSRFWGPVPQHSIIGVAFVTYWPPDRIGTL
jgi:signal peptidase I